jgi:CRP-like cAMP-binding protein
MEETALHVQLRNFKCLSEHDFFILDQLLEKKRTVKAGSLLLAEGAKCERVTVLIDGWAIRYKSLPDGRRQILNFLLPGDIFGLFSPLFEVAQYGVETLTQVETLSFLGTKMLDAFTQSPRFGLAITWLAGLDERQLEEQIMRIGQRGAAERMAHLFMELHKRQVQAGIDEKKARRLPLTQPLLADTLGMSHVHANRSFRKLVRDGLVALHDQDIYLVDTDALAKFTSFDASYLNQAGVPSRTQQQMKSMGL